MRDIFGFCLVCLAVSCLLPACYCQSEILKDLYQELHGQEWISSVNWNQESVSTCYWYGVCCSKNPVAYNDTCMWPTQSEYEAMQFSPDSCCQSDGPIRGLMLGANNLRGSLSSTLFELSNLTLINLGSNQVMGSISGEVANLQDLSFFRISYNFVEGTIPSTLQQCSRLEVVDFSSNMMQGTIPDIFAKTPFLKEFSVNDNSLTGTLPANLWGSQSLEILDVARNKLEGTVATYEWALPSLLIWDISENSFSGNLSVGVPRSPNLKKLAVSGNLFKGKFPKLELMHLTALHMRDNEFTGDLDITGLPLLESVDFRHNAISSVTGIASAANLIAFDGSFNALGLSSYRWEELFTSSKLRVLMVSGNNITGTIPQTIANMTDLHTVVASFNSFAGYVPSLPANIREIDFSYNNLTEFPIIDRLGPKPYALMAAHGMCKLAVLILGSNSFGGAFDMIYVANAWKIHNCTPRLSIVDVSNSDYLAMRGGKFFPQSLKFVDVSRNQIGNGDALAFLSKLPQLMLYDFHSNQIPGDIPSFEASLSLAYSFVEGNPNLRNTSVTADCGGLDLNSIVSSNYGLPGGYLYTSQQQYSPSGTFLCPGVRGAQGAYVDMGSNYYSFCACACSSGYAGYPPNCEQCTVGHFAGAEGLHECMACPSGTYSDVVGSRQCERCPVGTHGPNAGMSKCFQCDENSFSGVEGQTQCTPCPANSYSKAGASSCSPCDFGFVTVGQIACFPLIFVLMPVLAAILFISILGALAAVALALLAYKFLLPAIKVYLEEKKERELTVLYQKLSAGEALSNLRIKFSDINFEEKIGSGSFGIVYRAVWQGTRVAVKELQDGMLFDEDSDQAAHDLIQKRFKEEVLLMSKLRHPNIVLLVGACTESPHLCLVTELLGNGSIYDMIQQNVKIEESSKVNWLLDVARGLVYLHSHGIVHRDIKSPNVLVSITNVAKLCDFGVSLLIRDLKAEQTKTFGSVAWMAPEVIQGNTYSESSDIYSYGIFMWELLSEEELFPGLSNLNVAVQVTEGQRPTIPSRCSVGLSVLIEHCWHADPASRVDLSSLIEALEGYQLLVDPSAERNIRVRKKLQQTDYRNARRISLASMSSMEMDCYTPLLDRNSSEG